MIHGRSVNDAVIVADIIFENDAISGYLFSDTFQNVVKSDVRISP